MERWQKILLAIWAGITAGSLLGNLLLGYYLLEKSGQLATCSADKETLQACVPLAQACVMQLGTETGHNWRCSYSKENRVANCAVVEG